MGHGRWEGSITSSLSHQILNFIILLILLLKKQIMLSWNFNLNYYILWWTENEWARGGSCPLTPKRPLSAGLDKDYCVCVCVLKFSVFIFFSFFFFCFHAFQEVMRLLFMNCSRICWLFHGEQCTCALFMNPQIPLFSNFFIKKWVSRYYSQILKLFCYSIFSFQFQ